MINKFLVLLLFFYSFQSLSQDIKSLEKELINYKGNARYVDKYKLAKKIFEYDPFNEKAIEYIGEYHYDSIPKIFDDLIKLYPDKPDPYFLRAKYGHYDKTVDYPDSYLSNFNKAIDIDSMSIDAYYYLGEFLYEDFIYPLEKVEVDETVYFDSDTLLIAEIKKDLANRKSKYTDSAEKALDNFKKCWELGSKYHHIIYLPIKQLECYLKIIPDKKYILPTSDDIFFPHSQFINLKTNWQCDFTINYITENENSLRETEWLELQLRGLKENSLYNSVVETGVDIYRFTWLRSFEKPIAVSIEKQNNNIYIHWKIGKGLGGYQPKGLKRKGKHRISEEQWNTFLKLLEKANYRELPNYEYFLILDGETWTLEHKYFDKFEAKHTNMAGRDFATACLYLIKLAKIKINDIDEYK